MNSTMIEQQIQQIRRERQNNDRQSADVQRTLGLA